MKLTSAVTDILNSRSDCDSPAATYLGAMFEGVNPLEYKALQYFFADKGVSTKVKGFVDKYKEDINEDFIWNEVYDWLDYCEEAKFKYEKDLCAGKLQIANEPRDNFGLCFTPQIAHKICDDKRAEHKALDVKYPDRGGENYCFSDDLYNFIFDLLENHLDLYFDAKYAVIKSIINNHKRNIILTIHGLNTVGQDYSLNKITDSINFP